MVSRLPRSRTVIDVYAAISVEDMHFKQSYIVENLQNHSL